MPRSLARGHQRRCGITFLTQTLHYVLHRGHIQLEAWRLKFPSKHLEPYPTSSEMASIFCSSKPFYSPCITRLHLESGADLRQEERKNGVGRHGFQDRGWRRPRDTRGLQGCTTPLALDYSLQPLCSQSCVRTGTARRPYIGPLKET